MELLKNCSWSGSECYGDSTSTTDASAGCSTKRVNDLANGSTNPDIIICYIGINDFFNGIGIPIADVQSMKDAVEAAYKMARKGETVLLSPCCASFDLFKSYEDRGTQFKECVRNL